jgi:integrase
MRRKMTEQVQPRHGEGSVVKLKQATSPTGESRYWYIMYSANGRQMKENSKTEDYQTAYNLLVKRRADLARGEQAILHTKLRYEHLRDLLIQDYITQRKLLHVRKDGLESFAGRTRFDQFFKGTLVSRITTDKIREYIALCQKDGIKDGTIRRQLICLRAAFNMAAREGKLLHVPYFPMPKDSEPAGKYIEPETFKTILAHLPEESRPFFTFLYHTGCRVGAMLQITWDMVNTDATEINLPARIIKARTPLTIILAGKALEPVSAMLKKMFRQADKPVFYNREILANSQLTAYRILWYEACAAAKLGENRPRIHDLRVSAAVNLLDSGLAQDMVMKIGGWKTAAMFSRYNLVNRDRLRKAMIQAGDYLESQSK